MHVNPPHDQAGRCPARNCRARSADLTYDDGRVRLRAREAPERAGEVIVAAHLSLDRLHALCAGE
jgi:hypothetical protein